MHCSTYSPTLLSRQLHSGLRWCMPAAWTQLALGVGSWELGAGRFTGVGAGRQLGEHREDDIVEHIVQRSRSCLALLQRSRKVWSMLLGGVGLLFGRGGQPPQGGPANQCPCALAYTRDTCCKALCQLAPGPLPRRSSPRSTPLPSQLALQRAAPAPQAHSRQATRRCSPQPLQQVPNPFTNTEPVQTFRHFHPRPRPALCAGWAEQHAPTAQPPALAAARIHRSRAGRASTKRAPTGTRCRHAA
jgi:hypothetical protein